MRGTIFVELLRMIEDQHGLDMVDLVLERSAADLSTDGAYTSVGNYAHAELLSLMGSITELLPEQAPTLLDDFAGYLILVFKRLHPNFFDASTNLVDFLISVETHIHQEVLKLYPGAQPPTVDAERMGEQSVEMHYRSHRPLAPFAVSLAKASARLFDTEIQVTPISESADNREAKFRIDILS